MPPKFSLELKRPLISDSYLDIQSRTSPCEANCPAGNPIQRLNNLVKEKRFEDALAYIRARNPFPGICGRVCHHPCERECNRNKYDEGLSIRALERAAFDYADMSLYKRPKRGEKTGKTVAVIGSGPAGLTAAYFLALFGHDVTIFEAASSLGGMMRTCIPEYRLPKDVVDREVGQILELGVQARTNTIVGRDISFGDIRKNYSACLIAVGTWKEKILNIEGVDLAVQGISFLKRTLLGQRHIEDEIVVIIGGGGVAYDCAFTAHRLGAKEIHIVCLEAKDCMVAHDEDIVRGEDEGIILHNSKMISKVLVGNNKPAGISYFDVASFQFDASGKLTAIPDSDSEQMLKAGMVIIAIGEEPDLGFLGINKEFKLGEKGTLEIDISTMATSVAGVFAAGDAVSGPGSVAGAVSSGRNCAISIDNYLRNTSNEKKSFSIDEQGAIINKAEETSDDKSLKPHIVNFDELMHVDYFQTGKKVPVKKLAAKSSSSFDEIVKGYGIDEAANEASRCFHCGHCFQCGSCVEDCPGYVLTMDENGPVISYPDECWHCGNCRISCPCGAVSYDFPLSMLV